MVSRRHATRRAGIGLALLLAGMLAACSATAPTSVFYLVFFPSDSTELSPIGRDVVNKAAEDARKQAARQITVNGYADNVGRLDYNVDLSERRAAAVKQALIESGFPGDQILALGIDAAKLPDAAAGGRRVEIKLIK